MDYYMHWILYFMQCIPSLFNSEYTLQVHAYVFRMAFRIRIYQEVIHKRIRQHVIIISEIGNDIYAGYITIPLLATIQSRDKWHRSPWAHCLSIISLLLIMHDYTGQVITTDTQGTRLTSLWSRSVIICECSLIYCHFIGVLLWNGTSLISY